MPDSKLTVVITGASAGVGRATARAYGERGANVGLISRGAEGLTAAAAEVEAAGGTPLVLGLDVADAKSVEAGAERVESELGPIDVWVNCAMAAVFAPVKDTTAEQFRRVTEVHISVSSTARWPRCPACCLATGARSCRSARPSPTGRSRCRRATAAPSMRLRDSPNR